MAAAVALALAVLSRSHVILSFVPLTALLLNEWPASVRSAARALLSRDVLISMSPLFVAVLLVASVMVVTRDPETGTDFVTALRQNVHWGVVRANLSQVPAQWVLAFPLGAVWTALHGRRMLRSRACWLAA